jgi:hypothetical protein
MCESDSIPVVRPTGLYTRRRLREILGASEKYLTAEIASGRLRAARVGTRHVCLGAWVLRWLERLPG